MYICILAPTAPQLSWARSTLKELYGGFGLRKTKQEQKHWVTKSHLDFFSKWSSYSFRLYYHVDVFFIIIYVLFYFLKWYISSCKSMQKLSVGNPLHSQKSFPMVSMGLQIIWWVAILLCLLSDGYFYINLPPIVMCLLSFFVDVSVLFDHMTTKSEPLNSALYTCCCWRENCILCGSIPKWLTLYVHFCYWYVMKEKKVIYLIKILISCFLFHILSCYDHKPYHIFRLLFVVDRGG